MLACLKYIDLAIKGKTVFMLTIRLFDDRMRYINEERRKP